jgi:hypothetical protein
LLGVPAFLPALLAGLLCLLTCWPAFDAFSTNGGFSSEMISGGDVAHALSAFPEQLAIQETPNQRVLCAAILPAILAHGGRCIRARGYPCPHRAIDSEAIEGFSFLLHSIEFVIAFALRPARAANRRPCRLLVDVPQNSITGFYQPSAVFTGRAFCVLDGIVHILRAACYNSDVAFCLWFWPRA